MPLGTTESATGFTHAFRVTHTDLDESTNNTAQVLELCDVKAGDIILGCAVHVLTSFADAADNAFNTTTIEVGDGGDVDRFLASQEVNANGTIITSKAGTGTLKAFTATDTVDIKVTSMSGKNLAALTKGELIVLLRIANMADIAKAAFRQ